MKRKGQAAMEFLMTYGWAILAAIIVIAVLAIYFRPSSLQASNAIITAPLYADAWNIQAGTPGDINLDITNNFGETITVVQVTATGTGDSSGINCQTGGLGEVNTTILSGNTNTTNMGVDGATGACDFTAGDAYTGDLIVRYTRSADGSGTPLSSTGTITDTAV